jgi:hypothetical protein
VKHFINTERQEYPPAMLDRNGDVYLHAGHRRVWKGVL